MPSVTLNHRAILLIGGGDAEEFLQRIVTADLTKLDDVSAMPCALLSPQGKVLHEFLISRGDEAFRIDVSRAFLPDLARRLMLYRLHAAVTFDPKPSAIVRAVWNENAPFRDTRFPVDTSRSYERGDDTASLDDWTRHRIANGVAEIGTDYGADALFPHDVSLAQNGGVAVRKGCYVGQEVVSRMHHRGTGRRRVAIVRGEDLPAPGTPIEANDRPIGTLGSGIDGTGLAVVRIDRAGEALESGHGIRAGDTPVTLDVPPGADWSFLSVDAAE